MLLTFCSAKALHMKANRPSGALVVSEQSPHMKNNIGRNREIVGVSGKDFFVCTVVQVNGNLRGVAKFMKDHVEFHANTSHAIVAGNERPEFTSDPADLPLVGESIIAFVSEGRDGYFATAWGPYRQYTVALAEIAARSPKVVPTVEFIPAVPAKRPNTAKRVPPRTPRIFQKKGAVPVPTPVSSDAFSLETAITGGYNPLSQPEAEATVTGDLVPAGGAVKIE